MAVISLSIVESEEEVIKGIPRFITLSTNIHSIIFYTVDGTIPTTNSDIYVGKLQLPTDQLRLTLNILATNGVDSSPIISHVYETTETIKNQRMFPSGTNARPNSVQGLNDPYPYGTPPIMPGQVFVGAAEAGFNVNNPLLPQISNAFDAAGNPTDYTNEPLNGVATKTLSVIYPERDIHGNPGKGIGYLPKSQIAKPAQVPEQANLSDKLFDPRALVIFQDFTKPSDPDMPVQINRQFYDQSDQSNVKYGANYFNSVDTPGPSGTFVKQHYNPTDQTLTYYYFNSKDNRWIISKTAFTPANKVSNYYNMTFSRTDGDRRVFQWMPWKGSYIF